MLAPLRTTRRARWARRCAFWALAAAALACDPPLDLTGKRCSNERPCPTGYLCSANLTCISSGPPSQVQNGGFEDGTTGWTVSHGTLATVDGGVTSATAAQWKPDGTGESVLTTLAPSVSTPVGDWYCARAWVLGTTDGPVELQILENGAPNAGATETVVPNGGTWKQVQTSTLSPNDALSVALVSAATSGARTLLVDDVALWHSMDNACR